jgi:succinate dehydrogenase/fumarate reductase flavoprotein subunit
MKLMEDNVNIREIEVMTSTTAKELLLDGNGHVKGILAKNVNNEIVFKSRKGVILACGGFEHNENMKLQFLEVKPYYSMAPLTHTGDGITMAMRVGAALWHMWHVHGSYGFKYPEFPVAFRMRHDGARDPSPDRPYYYPMRWIVVDQKGKRFMDEYPPAPQDTPHRFLAYFDPDLPGYPRIPCFLIFDETARLAGPIGRPLGLKEMAYQWSQDNSKELEMGWITKARTLEEMATKLGIPIDNLLETIRKWNNCVEIGSDYDFGRLKGTMFAPIETPPYYAMEAWPIIVNTQGGPEHNDKQQVLDVYGKPITGLYAVGELGSMFGHLYELGGNLGECISGGRIAARNICEEQKLPS